MRITLYGKILQPWAEDELLQNGSWKSGSCRKHFALFGWWIGIGTVWIECLCCKMKRPDPKPFSFGIHYFQVGYFAVSATRIP